MKSVTSYVHSSGSSTPLCFMQVRVGGSVKTHYRRNVFIG